MYRIENIVIIKEDQFGFIDCFISKLIDFLPSGSNLLKVINNESSYKFDNEELNKNCFVKRDGYYYFINKQGNTEIFGDISIINPEMIDEKHRADSFYDMSKIEKQYDYMNKNLRNASGSRFVIKIFNIDLSYQDTDQKGAETANIIALCLVNIDDPNNQEIDLSNIYVAYFCGSSISIFGEENIPELIRFREKGNNIFHTS